MTNKRVGAYLTVRSTVMVDEGSWPEPQLRTILPTRVHDAEVVDAILKKLMFFLCSQFSDAAYQIGYLTPLLPIKRSIRTLENKLLKKHPKKTT